MTIPMFEYSFAKTVRPIAEPPEETIRCPPLLHHLPLPQRTLPHPLPVISTRSEHFLSRLARETVGMRLAPFAREECEKRGDERVGGGAHHLHHSVTGFGFWGRERFALPRVAPPSACATP